MKILNTIILLLSSHILMAQIECESVIKSTEQDIQMLLQKGDYERAFRILDDLKSDNHPAQKCYGLGYIKYQEANIYASLDQQEQAFKNYFFAYLTTKESNYNLSTAAFLKCQNILIGNHQDDLIINLIENSLSDFKKEDKITLLKILASSECNTLDPTFKTTLEELYKITPDLELESYYRFASDLNARFFLHEKNYIKASTEFYKLAGLSKENGDIEGYVHWMNNYGYCMIQSGKTNDAISLYKSLLTTYSSASNLIDVRYNLAGAYNINQEKNSALLELSKIITSSTASNSLQAKAETAAAYIYFEKDELEDALEAIQRAEMHASLTKDKDLLIEVYTFYENYYTYFNDRNKARSFSQKIAELSESKSLDKINTLKSSTETSSRFANYIKEINEEISVSKEKILINEKNELDTKNKEQELQLLFAQQEIADRELTISKAEKEKATQQLLLTRLDLDKQQQENKIALLLNEKTNQELSLARLELDQKEQASQLLELEKKTLLSEKTLLQQRENIEKSKLEKRIGWTIAVLSAIGAFVALVLLSRLRRKNKIIRHQHEELFVKNKDIHESIQAAAAFQNGIAPEAQDLKSLFPDSMLLYLPLEEVSGDLPFVFTSSNGHKWLAAIDCIGHGIPAAMLSFTSYYSLKTTIQENDELNPGEILSKLHQSIIQSYIHKKESELNIGIDVSLIKIPPQKNTIEFSGAKSPLLTVKHNGESSLIRGDVYSVADFSTPIDFVFKNHQLPYGELQKVFIMSDGYAHQLNSETSKVFSLSRLTKLITLNLRKNMHELQNTLHEEHIQWKSKSQQTDDILLIGIQL